jgi:para-aminobenzoate synthetase component 1
MSADPVQQFGASPEPIDPKSNPLQSLQETATRLRKEPFDPRFPFAGGLAGVFAYELCHYLERIPQHQFLDFEFPRLSLGLYDWVFVWDHLRQTTHLVSQGWPETDLHARRHRAERRIQEVLGWLAHDGDLTSPFAPSHNEGELSPQFETRCEGISSNFSSAGFREAIGAVIEYIRAGDVFQVNLAQRLLRQQTIPSALQYLHLRKANRAPFAGFYDGGPWQLLSSSPERFLRTSGSLIETRPIKGTCPRTGDRGKDAQLGQALLGSIKNRAENVMIVDLMRNDLSRVCVDDSVTVTQLCGLETYTRVQHLVSVVQGELRQGIGVLDAIHFMFPGGSVTGAPKPRALELIAGLEPTGRGAYCGSFGYLSCGGASDLNLLIRTITAQRGWLQIPVGGGITARSDPKQEEEETWDKAAGMLAGL